MWTNEYKPMGTKGKRSLVREGRTGQVQLWMWKDAHSNTQHHHLHMQAHFSFYLVVYFFSSKNTEV